MIRIATILFAVSILVSCNRRLGQADYVLRFEDEFSRPDQLLSATSNWSVATPGTATFVLQNQRAYPVQGSSSPPSAFFNELIARNDAAVTVDIVTIGGTMASPKMLILARYDANSLAGSTGGYQCGFNGGNVVTLLRNGVVVGTASKAIDFFPGKNYLLTFTQADNTIFCSLSGDDTDQVGYIDSAVLRGDYAGLSGGVNTTNYAFFDNFRVYGR